jgi:hypothetical protein
MHAGFSRFIRPGAVFVDVNDPDMIAAVSADNRSLALVVRNGGTAERTYTFDLTALPAVGAAARVRRTSRTEDLASLDDAAIEGFSFVATSAPASITTFVVDL